MLKSDGSLALANKTSLVTPYGFSLFEHAFIITLVVEVLGAFVYSWYKKLPATFVLSVVLGNSIAVLCMWFLLPLIIRDDVLYHIIAASMVIGFEAFIIYKVNKPYFHFVSALPVSVMLNALSFILGGIIMLVLGGVFI